MLPSIAWKPTPTTTTQTTASLLGVAPDAVLAAGCPARSIPALAGSRIGLKLRNLQKCTRILRLPKHPFDASCKKVPPDASRNLGPRGQTIEKEELKTP